MKLLVEQIDDFEMLVEAREDGSKKYFLEGIFLQAEKLNRNKRLYPKSIMEKEVQRYITEVVDKNKAYGTHGHESSPKISEEKVSHRIRSLKIEGNDVYGKASILDNPNGQIIKSMIDDGGAFGMSSRALGSVKSINGINTVQEDFNIRCVDCVLDPSGIDCWVNGIMENAEWIYDSKQGWIEHYIKEEAQPSIEKSIIEYRFTPQDRGAVAIKLFENFMKKL